MRCSRICIYLICKDEGIVDAVRGAIEPVGNLTLVVMAEATEAFGGMAREEAALMLAHQESVGGVDGVIRLLRTIAGARRPLPLIAISDRHRPDQALAMLRAGAAEHLSRPLDLSRLTYLFDVLTVRARFAARPTAVAAHPTDDPAETMGRMMEQVRRVASQDTTILLGGETGHGQDAAGPPDPRALSPPRPSRSWSINCGALSATLIESEMFGHVKGAFTGADRDRIGQVRRGRPGHAASSTRSTRCRSALQAKLLRAVEERVFEPVGSNKSQPMQARLIAASNRPLDQEVAAGRFRADLYYRLNVIAVHPPAAPRAARRRSPPWSHQFIAEFAARSGRTVEGISAEALRAAAGTTPGRATSASFATSSSGPSRSAPAGRSARRGPARRIPMTAGRPRAAPPAPARSPGPSASVPTLARTKERPSGPDHRGPAEAQQQPPPRRRGARHQPDDALQEAA